MAKRGKRNLKAGMQELAELPAADKEAEEAAVKKADDKAKRTRRLVFPVAPSPLLAVGGKPRRRPRKSPRMAG